MNNHALFYVIDATDHPLTYTVPAALGPLQRGDLVLLPLRTRTCVGMYWEDTSPPDYPCKSVMQRLPYAARLTTVQCDLALWMHRYYLQPLSRCIRSLAPGFLWSAGKVAARQKRFVKQGAVNKNETQATQEHPDGPLNATVFRWALRGELTEKNPPSPLPSETEGSETPAPGGTPQHTLNADQEAVCNAILGSTCKTHLLFGVTGSGKTEVYLHLAKHFLEQKKSVLILVPEIALTPQMNLRFRAVFGPALAVLHSGLTPVEQEREWFRVYSQEATVVLGVRSAVFAPLLNLGLLVVDEEHDGSYKCEESPCYQARDVAVKRAHLENAICVLGSATPSLESYFNASHGRYLMHRLDKRAQGNMPHIEIIDAKEELQNWRTRFRHMPARQSSLIEFKGHVLSQPVIDLIDHTRTQGEQSMVIVNRRGYSNYCLCSDCGSSLSCPHCSVTTTLHKKGSVEVCHYCGFTRPRPATCFQCGSSNLLQMGAGTQSIEEDLVKQIPDLRVERLDRDMLSSQSRLTGILGRFKAGEVDCLVGTQILAKGHDFPKVTAVVILHVEDSLYIPDYRSGERTFQLILQASGRAGRGANKQGHVLLQSLVLGHPLVELALQGNTEAFLNRELMVRKMAGQPPFLRHILIECSDTQKQRVEARGLEIKTKLLAHWQTTGLNPDEVKINGPFPAPLERLRNEFRIHVAIIAQKSVLPYRLISPELIDGTTHKRGHGTLKINVDPYTFL